MTEFIITISLLRMSVVLLVFYGWIIPFLFGWVEKKSFWNRFIISFISFNSAFILLAPFMSEGRLLDLTGIIYFILVVAIIPAVWKHRGNLLSLVQAVEQRVVLWIILMMEKKIMPDRGKLGFILKKTGITEFLKKDESILFFGTLFINFVYLLIHPAPHAGDWFHLILAGKNIEQGFIWRPLFMERVYVLLVHFFCVMTQTELEVLTRLIGLFYWSLTMVILFRIVRIIIPHAEKIILVSVFLVQFLPTVLIPFPFEARYDGSPEGLYLLLFMLLPYIMVYFRNLQLLRRSLFFLLVFIGLLSGFYYIFYGIGMVILYGMFRPDKGKYLVRELFLSAGVLVFIYWVFFLFSHDSPEQFFRYQFFIPEEYLRFDEQIFPLNQKLVFLAAGFLFYVLVLQIFRKPRRFSAEQLWLASAFVIYSLPYLADRMTVYRYFDLDLYGFLISVFVLFFIVFLVGSIYRSISALTASPEIRMLVTAVLISMMFFPTLINQIRAGIKPQFDLHLPDAFFREYYHTISVRVPHTYAVVASGITLPLAMNRHYFLNYENFLNDYPEIDSLYHDVISLKGKPADGSLIPPPSILIFTGKPQANAGEKSFFYPDSQLTKKLYSWLDNYSRKERRQLKVFYDSPAERYFEIINIPNQSNVIQLLMNTGK